MQLEPWFDHEVKQRQYLAGEATMELGIEQQDEASLCLSVHCKGST